MAIEGSANMIGYGLAAIGPGIGIGLIFAAYLNGVARHTMINAWARYVARRRCTTATVATVIPNQVATMSSFLFQIALTKDSGAMIGTAGSFLRLDVLINNLAFHHGREA
jgi:hypothetical protein